MKKNKTATSFNGTRKRVAEMDVQHLSNTYWYHLLLCDKKLQWVFGELRRRKSKLLDYAPRIEFNHEIEYLEKDGFLKWGEPTEVAQYGVIRYNGKVIGNVVRPL
jgi:hypothetical protein